METTISSQAQEWDAGSGGEGERLERAEIADNYAPTGELASETGGERISGTNDLSKAIAHVIDNGSHFYTLPHPAVRIRFRDDSLRLVEFGSMHFEKCGDRSEVRAVEASVRMRSRRLLTSRVVVACP